MSDAGGQAFPRVLVLTANPFSRRHSNSLTLTTLFEGWPADRLAQVYVPFVTPVPPEFDVCRRIWALTPRGLRPVRPSAAAPPQRHSALRRAVMRLATLRAVRAAAHPVREALYSRRRLLAGPEMDEIRAFAPQLVFSSLGSLSLLRNALRMSRALGVPIVPFVTDDWITTEYREAVGGGRMRAAMLRAYAEVLERAPVRMVISDAMAEEYARRYGGEFLPFTATVDLARFSAAEPPARPGPVELVYAGQVGLGRWQALREIGEQLLALRGEGIEARLTVYTLPSHVELYGERLTLEPVMRLAGNVAHDRLPGVYAAADVLVHVESFDPATVEYTRYSLSTKAAEYLAAGRPVLAFGPAQLGTLRHLAASGAAEVVGDPSPGPLRGALRALLTDPARRLEMGRRGRAFAERRHEGRDQRARFRAALAGAVSPPDADATAAPPRSAGLPPAG